MTTDPEESAELDRMCAANCTCCGVAQERACEPWCGMFGGIHDERGYKRALWELERRGHGHPAPGTPDGDRLLALANALKAYEITKWPDRAQADE